MKYWILFLPLFLSAEETPPAVKTAAPAQNTNTKSLFQIDPKARAHDLVEAFQLLKADKPTFKIALRCQNGFIHQNLIEVSASLNGTLLYIKTMSNHGGKLFILGTEEIEEIFYSQ